MSFGDQRARKTETLEMARSSWGELPELVSWLERTLAKFDMLAGESADTYIQRHGLLDPLVRHFFTDAEEDGADDGTLSSATAAPQPQLLTAPQPSIVAPSATNGASSSPSSAPPAAASSTPTVPSVLAPAPPNNGSTYLQSFSTRPPPTSLRDLLAPPAPSPTVAPLSAPRSMMPNLTPLRPPVPAQAATQSSTNGSHVGPVRPPQPPLNGRSQPPTAPRPPPAVASSSQPAALPSSTLNSPPNGAVPNFRPVNNVAAAPSVRPAAPSSSAASTSTPPVQQQQVPLQAPVRPNGTPSSSSVPARLQAPPASNSAPPSPANSTSSVSSAEANGTQPPYSEEEFDLFIRPLLQQTRSYVTTPESIIGFLHPRRHQTPAWQRRVLLSGLTEAVSASNKFWWTWSEFDAGIEMLVEWLIAALSKESNSEGTAELVMHALSLLPWDVEALDKFDALESLVQQNEESLKARFGPGMARFAATLAEEMRRIRKEQKNGAPSASSDKKRKSVGESSGDSPRKVPKTSSSKATELSLKTSSSSLSKPPSSGSKSSSSKLTTKSPGSPPKDDGKKSAKPSFSSSKASGSKSGESSSKPSGSSSSSKTPASSSKLSLSSASKSSSSSSSKPLVSSTARSSSSAAPARKDSVTKDPKDSKSTDSKSFSKPAPPAPPKPVSAFTKKPAPLALPKITKKPPPPPGAARPSPSSANPAPNPFEAALQQRIGLGAAQSAPPSAAPPAAPGANPVKDEKVDVGVKRKNAEVAKKRVTFKLRADGEVQADVREFETVEPEDGDQDNVASGPAHHVDAATTGAHNAGEGRLLGVRMFDEEIDYYQPSPLDLPPPPPYEGTYAKHAAARDSSRPIANYLSDADIPETPDESHVAVVVDGPDTRQVNPSTDPGQEVAPPAEAPVLPEGVVHAQPGATYNPNAVNSLDFGNKLSNLVANLPLAQAAPVPHPPAFGHPHFQPSPPPYQGSWSPLGAPQNSPGHSPHHQPFAQNGGFVQPTVQQAPAVPWGQNSPQHAFAQQRQSFDDPDGPWNSVPPTHSGFQPPPPTFGANSYSGPGTPHNQGGWRGGGGGGGRGGGGGGGGGGNYRGGRGRGGRGRGGGGGGWN